MRLVGPNALGVANNDPSIALNATLAPRIPPLGRVGFFCQSGALGIAILGLFIIGGKMAYDSRRGETTEEVGSLIKLVMAVTLISGGASLIGFIVG